MRGVLTDIRRDVAQLGSAPAWGAGGRRFKSSHPDHIPKKATLIQWPFLFMSF